MIPIRALQKDVAIAFCVVAFSVGVTGLSTTTTPGTVREPTVIPLPQPPQSNTVTETANALPVATSTATVGGTATATRQIATGTSPILHTSSTKNIPKGVPPKLIPKKGTATTSQSAATYLIEISRLIGQQTNEFRTSHKLSILNTDTALTRNAASYSKTLLAGNFLSHTDMSGCDMTCRFTRDGYTDATAWGENLAVLHFSGKPTAAYVASYFMQAWKKSAGHRENLLNPSYTHTGIGVATDDHSTYVTVQFSKLK